MAAALAPALGVADEPTLRIEPIDEAEPSQIIDRYKILQKLGEGGCGVVYMAEQTEPVRRKVALKVIKLGMDTKQVIARFEAERQALALMDHPNIAKVLDAGATETGRPYFVMELVKGIRITEYCDQHHLATAERLGLFTQVCQAIQHAHQKGIIHRDIKPSNILVTLHDGVPVPKVIDFGIAKATEQPLTEKTVFTAFGQFMGTPAYMSPEQAELSGLDIDTRSDIYALGVLLYELLTGRTPFDAKELLQAGLDEMRRIIREEEPMRPSTRLSTMVDADLTEVAQRRQSVPAQLTRFIRGDLDWIVMKCLEKDRTRRYETANGLAMDLRRHLRNEPVVACPPSAVYRFQKLVRRNRLAFVAFAAVVAALLAGLGIATWEFLEKSRAYNWAVQAEKNAQTEAAKSQQVARFLKETLLAAGPSVARGRDATVLREMLEKTSERVSSEIKDQPQVQGDLYSAIGNTFVDIGEHRRAITNFEQAVTSYHLVFQGDHTNLAYTLSALGFCQSFTGDVARGNNNARLGVEMARRCGDPEILFTCLWRYAGSFRGWGMFPAESKPYLREAYDLKKQMGNDPVGLASAMHLYSGFLTNVEEQEQMLRDALDLFRKHLPPEHPKTIQGVFSLGQLLVNGGKFAEAEQVMTEALQGFHKIHDVNHPYQSIVLRYLIYALIGQGKMKEAETELQKHAEAFPANVNYYYMLIRFRMQHGSPGGATGPLLKDLQAKLEQGEFSYPWAISLLHVGAEDKYQEYRHGFLNTAFVHNDFQGKLEVAKTLLLLGGDPEDVEQSCRFAQLAITNVTAIELYSAEVVRALLAFRRGEFAEAKQWATTVVTREDGWKPRICEGWLLRALACSRLNLPASARAALAEGDHLLTKNLPVGTEAYLYAGDEWILARYLRSQARKEVAALPESSLAEEDGNAGDTLAFITDPQGRANIFAQREQWTNAALELAKAIELAPTNHWLYFRRGEILGRMGLWSEAAANLRRSIDTEPTNSRPHFLLAPILLFSGDVQGYRQHCQRIVARFAETTDAGVADTMAKACLIHPASGVDLGVVAELAEKAVTLGKQSEYLPWFEMCKGLAEYRQDHFAGAADWAQKALASSGQLLERDACAYLVLAMARTKLKQDGAARGALSKARELLDGKIPKLDGGDLGGQWVDVVIANLLLREARALIEDDGTQGTDTAKVNH
jgi:tetratricopeptide (TPR) repeat protein